MGEGVRLNGHLTPREFIMALPTGMPIPPARFRLSGIGWENFAYLIFGLVLLAGGAVAVYRKRVTAGRGGRAFSGTLLGLVATTGFFGTAMSILLITVLPDPLWICLRMDRASPRGFPCGIALEAG